MCKSAVIISELTSFRLKHEGTGGTCIRFANFSCMTFAAVNNVQEFESEIMLMEQGY